MRKLTNEEFIKKAKDIYGDKYDYSKVVYVNSKEKVCIICPVHGSFWIKPNDHLMGHGCPECYYKKTRLGIKDFVEKSIKIHGNKYDYSKAEYVNSYSKICIICPEHGEFWQTPHNHLKGYGCKKCGNKSKIATEGFIKKAKEIHSDKYDYSKVEYNGTTVKVCITCPNHGDFWQLPYVHIRGNGCPKCAGKNKTTEDFIEAAKSIHNNKYDYSKINYIDSTTKVPIICPKHGIFWQTPKHHLGGHGCPVCKESNLEKEVRCLLEKNEIKYVKNCNSSYFKWLGKQHLDFYLPEYNIAIECQGEQHFVGTNFGSKTLTNEEAFSDVLKRDEIKKRLCIKNRVKLLYYSNLGIVYPYDVIENENYLLKEIKNGRGEC